MPKRDKKALPVLENPAAMYVECSTCGGDITPGRERRQCDCKNPTFWVRFKPLYTDLIHWEHNGVGPTCTALCGEITHGNLNLKQGNGMCPDCERLKAAQSLPGSSGDQR